MPYFYKLNREWSRAVGAQPGTNISQKSKKNKRIYTPISTKNKIYERVTSNKHMGKIPSNREIYPKPKHGTNQTKSSSLSINAFKLIQYNYT